MLKHKKPVSFGDLRYYLLDKSREPSSEASLLSQPMPNDTRCLYYVLDEEGRPIPEPDLVKWAQFFESGTRVLKKDNLPNGTSVTTVFLAVDTSGDKCGPPILWGTMIFGGPHDKYEERYASPEDALAGHEKALARASGKPQ